MTTAYNSQKVLDALKSDDQENIIRACEFCAEQDDLTPEIIEQLKKLQYGGTMYTRYAADAALTEL